MDPVSNSILNPRIRNFIVSWLAHYEPYNDPINQPEVMTEFGKLTFDDLECLGRFMSINTNILDDSNISESDRLQTCYEIYTQILTNCSPIPHD